MSKSFELGMILTEYEETKFHKMHLFLFAAREHSTSTFLNVMKPQYYRIFVTMAKLGAFAKYNIEMSRCSTIVYFSTLS